MSRRLAVILCLLLAIASGAISFCAAITKSPTIDEPTHFAAAYAHTFLHDDRSDPENPVLWKSWAMLPISRNALQVDQNSAAWKEAGLVYPPHSWMVPALFEPGADHGIGQINRARFAMMLLGVALCGLSAWFAYRLAGAWAAVAASALLALDPTLLAHAPIIKNDVAMTLAMLAAVFATWHVGRRLTWLNSMCVAFACAVAINTKFSAMLVPIIVSIALLCRALMPAPWSIVGREIRSRTSKLLVVPAMLLLIALATAAMTWAAYGFRYAPSSDPSLSLQIDEPYSGFVDRAAMFAADHHLLPQAFCIGFVRQHNAINQSRNYLLGALSDHGWWYYFPFAFLVKTPLATLAAMLIALIVAIRVRRKPQVQRDPWSALCLLIPVVIYLLAAMQSDLNHGLRHLLPIFPLVYIGVAIAFARAITVWPRTSISIATVLFVGLAVESLWAFPNYIPFFNVAACGSRGGLSLLSDSNLDWGQDLPLLVKWQREHPNTKLYLAYFGALDPARLGVAYSRLPTGYWGPEDASPPDPNQPGVLAISASVLQGVYVRDPWDRMYSQIRIWKPRQVLGGSIYLYDFPPPDQITTHAPASGTK